MQSSSICMSSVNPYQETYITGSMSGSFGSNNRNGIRLQVITFSDMLLPGKFVVFLKWQITVKSNNKR